MKRNLFAIKVVIMTFFIVAANSTTAFPQAKKADGKQVMLAYNPQAGRILSCSHSTSVTQMMDVEGQSVNVLINTILDYKAKLINKQNDNLNLEITIDSLKIDMEAMGNATGGNFSEVKGKSFPLIISPAGKVLDASGADKIEYSSEGQTFSSLGQTFRNLFPVLPGRSVGIGEKWTSKDTLDFASSGAKVYQIFESSGTYEGNEKVDGIECARISVSLKGTMETKTQNMGMDIFVHGPVTGESVIWFAIKDGYVVKEQNTSKMNGTVELTGPQNMSFPVIMDTSTKLIVK